MENLKAIIIDDEQESRNTLKKFISIYCPEVNILAEGGSVKEGIEIINQNDPELVFLDVHLPDGDGFDILQQLSDIRFDIIFTTGFDKFAIKAIKYSAIDYLLKPLIPEELQEAVSRLIRKRRENSKNEPVQRPENVSHDLHRIAVPDRNGLKIISLNKIIYCAAEGNYTQFILSDNPSILVCKTLKEYESLLPSSTFVRIHNSYIINLDHVQSYIKGRGGQVEMTNGTFLDIARNRKQLFLDKITGGRE